MRRLAAIGASLLFVLGTVACGGGDSAGQQESATGQKAGSAGPQVQVSDSELRSFIEASMELEAFQREMRKRMKEAAGAERGREVRQQLMQERDSIVEAAGLSGTARYDTIMQAIKASEKLRKRYTSLREKMEADTAAVDTAG